MELEAGPDFSVLPCELAAMSETVRDQEVDAILLSSCETGVHFDALSPGVRSAADAGIPSVFVCACNGPTHRRGLTGLASNLPQGPTPDQLVTGIRHALLERKAWLLANGRPSAHLAVSVERNQ